MATSQWRQISAILDWVLLLQPRRVLDVGAGFGKYGMLCREYLDVFEGRLRREEWTAQVDGIEGYDGCITPVHAFVYNTLHHGDALDVLRERPAGAYDLALVIDVIEHFEFDASERLLDECRRVSSYVLVSTPKLFFAQGAEFGNPREIHRSEWAPGVLSAHGGVVVHEDEISSVAIFAGSSAALSVQDYLRRVRKRRLAARFPSSYRLYRRIGGLFHRHAS
jgi:hypothetical protein